MAARRRLFHIHRSPSTPAAGAAGLGSAGRPHAAYLLLQDGFQLQERPPEVSTESKITEQRKRFPLLSSCIPTATVIVVMISSSEVKPARASVIQLQ